MYWGAPAAIWRSMCRSRALSPDLGNYIAQLPAADSRCGHGAYRGETAGGGTRARCAQCLNGRSFRRGEGDTVSYLDRIAECHRWEPDDYRPFIIDDMALGRVPADMATRLADFPNVFQVSGRAVSLVPDLSGVADRTAAVADVLGRMRAAGDIPRWRDEAYPILRRWGEAPLLTIERAAVPTVRPARLWRPSQWLRAGRGWAEPVGRPSGQEQGDRAGQAGSSGRRRPAARYRRQGQPDQGMPGGSRHGPGPGGAGGLRGPGLLSVRPRGRPARRCAVLLRSGVAGQLRAA